jgi:hypothetical protein
MKIAEAYLATQSRICHWWRGPVTRWVLLCLLALSVGLDSWGLRPWGGPVDHTQFGTYGDWVSGVGAVSAVVVALGIANRQQLHEQMERESRLAEEHSQFYAWLRLTTGTHASENSWDLVFNNETPVPIYDWVLRLQGLDGHYCHVTNGPIIPGITSIDLGGGESSLPAAPGSVVRTKIVFVDREGVLWERAFGGSCTARPDLKGLSTEHSCGTS